MNKETQDEQTKQIKKQAKLERKQAKQRYMRQLRNPGVFGDFCSPPIVVIGLFLLCIFSQWFYGLFK